MKISLQKYFDPNNYLDREYGKIQAQKPNNTPKFVPYYNGTRNNYNELQTSWEQLNLLKIGEEITEDDKKKLIETYQNAVIEKLKEEKWMNVRNASDMAMILRIINKREKIDALVEEMQQHIREKWINADVYKGQLHWDNGNIKLIHKDSILNYIGRPQMNVDINFPITHTEIIENLKIEKRAQILANKQLETLQKEMKEPQIIITNLNKSKESDTQSNLTQSTHTTNNVDKQKEEGATNTSNTNTHETIRETPNTTKNSTEEMSNKTETEKIQKIKSIQEKIGFTGADIDGIVWKKTESAIMGYNSRAKNGGENLEITENMTPDQIKEIQTKLGFLGNLVDGIVGARTRAALMAYNHNTNKETIDITKVRE